jgi:hypothetical protein
MQDVMVVDFLQIIRLACISIRGVIGFCVMPMDYQEVRHVAYFRTLLVKSGQCLAQRRKDAKVQAEDGVYQQSLAGGLLRFCRKKTIPLAIVAVVFTHDFLLAQGQPRKLLFAKYVILRMGEEFLRLRRKNSSPTAKLRQAAPPRISGFAQAVLTACEPC